MTESRRVVIQVACRLDASRSRVGWTRAETLPSKGVKSFALWCDGLFGTVASSSCLQHGCLLPCSIVVVCSLAASGEDRGGGLDLLQNECSEEAQNECGQGAQTDLRHENG